MQGKRSFPYLISFDLFSGYYGKKRCKIPGTDLFCDLWQMMSSLCCTEYKKYEEIFPEGSKSELEMEMSQNNLCKVVSQTDFLRMKKILLSTAFSWRKN